MPKPQLSADQAIQDSCWTRLHTPYVRRTVAALETLHHPAGVRSSSVADDVPAGDVAARAHMESLPEIGQGPHLRPNDLGLSDQGALYYTGPEVPPAGVTRFTRSAQVGYTVAVARRGPLRAWRGALPFPTRALADGGSCGLLGDLAKRASLC